jgi:glycosyltransferase involved in cell wall biosynthesis
MTPKNPARILLINQFYPPDTAATGQLLADVAHELVRRGHHVHVVCSAGGYGGGRVERDATDSAGVHVHRIGASGRGRVSTWDRLCDWGSYYALASTHALRLGRFDACLVLTTPPFIGLLGSLLKRMRGTRFVLWSMDVWPDVAEALGTIKQNGFLSGLLRPVARRIHGSADAIISLGPAMTDLLVERGAARDRVHTVHNWVPAETVQARAWGRSYMPRLGLDGKFVVMYSGNMGMAHEFDTFLDAAAALRDEPEISFVFVGGGKRRPAVQQRVEAEGLSNVRLEDAVPLDQLSELMASARVHLLSMRTEVDGCLVPSKAYGILAAGRPCVMVGPRRSDVGQLLEQSQAGLVVRRGDARRLAQAIRRLRARPQMARGMGRAGREYYETHLGRDRSVARIADALLPGPA